MKGFRTVWDVALSRLYKLEELKLDSGIDIGFKVFRVADTNIKWNSLMDMGRLIFRSWRQHRIRWSLYKNPSKLLGFRMK
jgi:hypothetical protein